MEILSTFDEYVRKVGRYKPARHMLTPSVLNQRRYWPNYAKAPHAHLLGYAIVDEPSHSLIAYARWHRLNYMDPEDVSQEWTQGVEAPKRTEAGVGYFDDHSQAAFPYVVGRSSPAWTDHLVAGFLEKLLLGFASPESIEVARSIPATDFSIKEENRHALAADIENTTVDINLEQHTIVHRCPTWAESNLDQKFCPHVVKLFLGISPKKAETTLAHIQSDLKSWEFQLAVEFPIEQ